MIVEKLQGSEEADVVVVGSGIAGISCAYHLQKAGFKVAVLEEFEVGSGATQYSSGILYFGSGTDFQTAIRLWGREKAKLFFNESKKAIDEMLEIITDKNLQVGLRSPGVLIVARDEQEEKYLQSEANAMQELGYPGELLKASQVHDFYNGANFRGALHQPFCHQIKPSLFVPQLAKTLESNIFENSPMLKITENAESVVIESNEGKVEADQVVIATNLKPVFNLEKHFFQESSVLLPSQPLGEEEITQLWPRDKILWTPDERYDLLYTHDGIAFLEMYNLQGVDDKVKRYFPLHVKFQHNKSIGDAWSKTSDWRPIVGKVKPRVSVAVAMGDQGIVMGFASGKNIARLLKGEGSTFLEMCSPNRF